MHRYVSVLFHKHNVVLLYSATFCVLETLLFTFTGCWNLWCVLVSFYESELVFRWFFQPKYVNCVKVKIILSVHTMDALPANTTVEISELYWKVMFFDNMLLLVIYILMNLLWQKVHYYQRTEYLQCICMGLLFQWLLIERFFVGKHPKYLSCNFQ